MGHLTIMGHVTMRLTIAAAMAAAMLSGGVAYAAQNGANDYMLKQSPAKQASLLTKAIGRGCVARSVFFMGIGAPGFPKNQAFWSAKCANGTGFVVQIAPNGANQVLECSVFMSLNGAPCFKKLPTK